MRQDWLGWIRLGLGGVEGGRRVGGAGLVELKGLGESRESGGLADGISRAWVGGSRGGQRELEDRQDWQDWLMGVVNCWSARQR